MLFAARTYKIFVSGVFADVGEEREIVATLMQRFGHTVLNLANYPTTAAAINECDVFLLITGSLYGQIVIPDYGAVNLRGVVSVVEAEFRYAATRKKQIRAFVREGRERDDVQELFVSQVRSRLGEGNFEPYTMLHEFRTRLEAILTAGDLLDPPRRVRLPMFVSYSRADDARVHPLIDVVENDVPVWIDRDQLVAGQNLTARIRDAIVRAGFVLAFLSGNSVTRPWVHEELNHARALEQERDAELILPVLLDDIEPVLARPEAQPVFWLREFLNGRIYVDLRDPEKYGMGTKLLIQSAREKYATLVWRD